MVPEGVRTPTLASILAGGSFAAGSGESQAHHRVMCQERATVETLQGIFPPLYYAFCVSVKK